MIIALEGPDGTGKTTLAREFEKLGFEYRHNGPPPAGADMFEEYTKQLEAVRVGEHVVFDRLHIGEIVYGDVVRSKPGLTIHQLRVLNRLLFAKGGVLVMSFAPSAEIIERWLARKGQEYVQQTPQMQAIISYYHRIMESELRLMPNVVRYKMNDWPNPPRPFAEMLWYNRHEYRDTLKDGVTGSPRNRYLFVGEQPNGPRDIAFHANFASAGYLNDCIWEAGYLEHEVAFTNAKDAEGKKRDLYALYTPRPHQVVIALGDVAADALDRQGVPHLTSRHPQWMKRFHSKRRQDYVKELRSFHVHKSWEVSR